jgi:hypothetical protein
MVWMTCLFALKALTTQSPGNPTGAQTEPNPDVELPGWLKLEANGQAPVTQPLPLNATYTH